MKPGQPVRTVTIKLSDQQYAAINAIAKQEKVSKATIAKVAVERYLARQRQDRFVRERDEEFGNLHRHCV